MKNEDENKGSLASSSKTEIFRDSDKHSISNALFCSFWIDNETSTQCCTSGPIFFYVHTASSGL